MSIAITKEERDALYERIVIRLNGIDDVHRVVEQEDWDAAQKLGQEFSDLLRFVCSDLGWGEGSQANLNLSSPTDVLDRAAQTLLHLAKCDQAYYDDQVKAAKEGSDEAGRLRQACERILEGLESR